MLLYYSILKPEKCTKNTATTAFEGSTENEALDLESYTVPTVSLPGDLHTTATCCGMFQYAVAFSLCCVMLEHTIITCVLEYNSIILKYTIVHSSRMKPRKLGDFIIKGSCGPPGSH